LRETEHERARAETASVEEARLRGEAETAKETAEQLRERAEFTLYVNRVMRAHFEWKDNAVARADRLLHECPRQFRNWEWHYVKRLCHSELLTFRGHTDKVFAVAFSPDGKRLASAAADRTIKVWDAVTGQELFTLRGHHDPVRSVCFSPN